MFVSGVGRGGGFNKEIAPSGTNSVDYDQTIMERPISLSKEGKVRKIVSFCNKI